MKVYGYACISEARVKPIVPGFMITIDSLKMTLIQKFKNLLSDKKQQSYDEPKDVNRPLQLIAYEFVEVY